MMAMIVLTDNDVYTVPERMETGVVLLVVLFLTYLLLLFSGCDSAGDRSAGRVRPRPCNGTHPLLSGRGNRAHCARRGRLDARCALAQERKEEKWRRKNGAEIRFIARVESAH
jgi:hypothetical protein